MDNYVIGTSKHTGKTRWEATREAAEAAGMTNIRPAPAEMCPHIDVILAADARRREPPQSVIQKLGRMLGADHG